ncbi:MAG: UDP-N-acetylmuramoyl-tripeptide--D-alanyl-D-alanine ligase [Candidatus Peribacteraceae bacterium]|nr:UDP-N-acetylmuramoyl-tripeptide--D-alanyl-D-alanine ligase [Candidatus Peribacteraceae bacterium]
MSLLLILLALTATLSPLLTGAALWQIKEWRMDRLREHLRSEGTFSQIFGTLRPAILACAAPLLLLSLLSPSLWTLSVLALLAALTIAQCAADRQPYPTWTLKALAIVSGAFLLLTAAAIILAGIRELLLVLLPFLAPIGLALAWLVFLPIDRLLKRHIMTRAGTLRAHHPDLTVIGITGSVGKTTTKELLLHLLKPLGAHATPAYVNTEMGVARWLITELSVPQPPRILIVEMGAYRRGEIALLARIARPTIGIITFIGTQHIALFKSQENLLHTKAELFRALPAGGLAILNADSPFSNALKALTVCPTITVSTGEHADIEATEIEETPNGIRFRLGLQPVTVPLHGTHNVSNALLAIVTAENLGLKRAEIVRSLAGFRPPEHTFAVRTPVRGITLLDDTHNASVASFRAAIVWAKAQPEETKVLLTSGLIELGEAEDRVHAALGVEAADTFDRVIFTHRRHARAFEQGYGKPVETLGKLTQPVTPPALLACIGRISQENIRRLLP